MPKTCALCLISVDNAKILQFHHKVQVEWMEIERLRGGADFYDRVAFCRS